MCVWGGGLMLGSGAVYGQYDRGPHMQQWDSTGGTHYQPHRDRRGKGGLKGMGCSVCVSVFLCLRM